MVIHIKRELGPCGRRSWSILEKPALTGAIKRTFTFMPLRNLWIYENQKECIYATQRGIIAQILYILPVLPVICGNRHAPITIYQNGAVIGFSKILKRTDWYSFSIQETQFDIYFHSKCYMSIWKAGQQVGLAQVDWDGNWTVRFNPFDSCSERILLLFCMIFEGLEFPGPYKKFHYICFHDPRQDAIHWVPDSCE